MSTCGVHITVNIEMSVNKVKKLKEKKSNFHLIANDGLLKERS